MSETPLGPDPIPDEIVHLNFSVPTSKTEFPVRTPHCDTCGRHAIVFLTEVELGMLQIVSMRPDTGVEDLRLALHDRDEAFIRLVLDGTHETCA